MGVNVIQLTSKKYHENILASLQQLRLQGHLSDVTVQVDYEGDVQEFQAHKVMLAASSGYFKEILLSQDASLQDKFILSNMHFDYFSKFLEFVYTGKIEVARGKIADVLAAALSLDCKDLAEVCGEAMTAGILDSPTKKQANHVVDNDDLHGDEKEKGTKRKMQPKGFHSSPSPEKEVQAKRSKDKDGCKKTKVKKLKLRLAGRKVLQRRLTMKQVNFNNENKASDEDTEMEAQVENPGDKDDESFLVMQRCPADDWECEEDEQSTGPEEALMLSLSDEEEEEQEQSTESSIRASKAQFQCNKCQRTFHYERSYLKHISTYHGVKADVIYRCEICQQTFANRSNLKIHEKHVHSTERLFSCDRCTKTFKRKKDVVRHERQVHDRDNLQHVCSLCGKSLSSKTALLLHERTHTGAKPFECTECSAKFTQNSALKMHRRIHTGEKPFACEDCDARFTQKHMLIYHKRSHTGEKPFMCEACGKSFSSKEYLRHHSNIHTGSKPYKCEQCNRCFAQRNSLHQHLKIHTGERPYSCKDCEKQFTQLNALQRHQRIHTGEKPYMCGLCSRTFTDKSTLRRHTMIHDSEAPWKTYLVVLEGNIEDKKTKSPPKGKVEKAGAGEKKATARKSIAPLVADDGTSTADSSAKTHTDSVLVPAVPVTLPADWTTHGAIAVVSHGTVSGIAVIHTDMPPGTQFQPIVTTEGMATGVISLDASVIPVPFSIPVPIAHPIPLSSEVSTISLSVPVSDGTSASVPATSTICNPSILEAAASQIILAPVSESSATSQVDDFPSDIQSVVADNCETENMDAGQQRTEDNPLTELKEAPPEDAE